MPGKVRLALPAYQRIQLSIRKRIDAGVKYLHPKIIRSGAELSQSSLGIVLLPLVTQIQCPVEMWGRPLP